MYKNVSGGIIAPQDFLAAGINCGLKKRKKDLALIYSAVPCVAAGVFTVNRVKAAPVLLTQKRVSKGTARTIIINSGNANCCTGRKGESDALKMANMTAKELGISAESVLVCSTGKIGENLPMEKIAEGIPRLVKKLSKKEFKDAAEAILTTDLVTKHAAMEFLVGKKKVTIGAIAKGSGMIQPDMATMLAFITTDAVINRAFMRGALKKAVGESFNRITVDGDMSTNDTVLIMANGAAGNTVINGKKSGAKFQDALAFICRTLAKKIVEDGEGATKFITVRVERAKSKKDAETVARAIADSPLVKTAVHGENPNWGRIMASVGSSGIKFNPAKTNVYINELRLVKSGARAKYDEKKARAIMKNRGIKIRVDLASGGSAEEIWTCDFSRKYVDINV